MATRKEAFGQAVKAQIDGDRKHGWGAADSLAVIVALFNQETGDEMDAELQGMIKAVINPSQFRQGLEGKLLDKPEATKRVSTLKGLLADLG